jgi:hypothetical protein
MVAPCPGPLLVLSGVRPRSASNGMGNHGTFRKDFYPGRTVVTHLTQAAHDPGMPGIAGVLS